MFTASTEKTVLEFVDENMPAKTLRETLHHRTLNTENGLM